MDDIDWIDGEIVSSTPHRTRLVIHISSASQQAYHITDLSSWCEYLKEQYCAGTPVMIFCQDGGPQSLLGYVEPQLLRTSPLQVEAEIDVSVSTTSSTHTVPKPNYPLDIRGNNGIMKLVNPSGIPSEYEELEYIESSGTQYIDTGRAGDNNTKVYAEYYYPSSSDVSGSGRIFGSRYAVTSRAFTAGTMTGTTDTRMLFGGFDGQAVKTNASETPLQTWFAVEVSVNGFFVDGVQVGDAWTAETFTTPENLKLFGFENNGSMGYGIGRCRRYKRWDNTVLTQDLIPARRRSDSEVGMYDLVSGTFLTNAGTGDFTAGSAAAPVVKMVGTQETVHSRGVNIIDTTMTRDTSINANYWLAHQNELTFNSANLYVWEAMQNITTSSNYWNNTCRSFALPCKEGDVFRVKGYNGDAGTASRKFIAFVSASNVVLSRDAWTEISTHTAPANAAYVFIEWASSDDTNIDGWVVTKNTPLPAKYQPYFSDGTALAEDLLKMGNYVDTQSVLDGIVNRRLAVAVFDGTEDWKASSTAGIWYTAAIGSARSDTRIPLLSSHYVGTDEVNAQMPNNSIKLTIASSITTSNCIYIKDTAHADVNSFKAFLAAEYAARDPVIAIYPLATAAQESVASQPMTITKGNNVIEITEAAMSPLVLSATYKRKKRRRTT